MGATTGTICKKKHKNAVRCVKLDNLGNSRATSSVADATISPRTPPPSPSWTRCSEDTLAHALCPILGQLPHRQPASPHGRSCHGRPHDHQQSTAGQRIARRVGRPAISSAGHSPFRLSVRITQTMPQDAAPARFRSCRTRSLSTWCEFAALMASARAQCVYIRFPIPDLRARSLPRFRGEAAPTLQCR